MTLTQIFSDHLSNTIYSKSVVPWEEMDFPHFSNHILMKCQTTNQALHGIQEVEHWEDLSGQNRSCLCLHSIYYCKILFAKIKKDVMRAYIKGRINTVILYFSSDRINLSLFAKDFCGEEQLKFLTDLFRLCFGMTKTKTKKNQNKKTSQEQKF